MQVFLEKLVAVLMLAALAASLKRSRIIPGSNIPGRDIRLDIDSIDEKVVHVSPDPDPSHINMNIDIEKEQVRCVSDCGCNLFKLFRIF
jgi:hypothetical protein